MTELQSMREAIAYVAIGCGILSFLVYLAFSWKAVTSKKVEKDLRETVASVRGMGAPTVEQLAEVLKALASLAESLVKAGPALWAMIGSALFLLIASLAAGVFWGA
jgi:hypothetical protein